MQGANAALCMDSAGKLMLTVVLDARVIMVFVELTGWREYRSELIAFCDTYLLLDIVLFQWRMGLYCAKV